MSGLERSNSAVASDAFNNFCSASVMRQIITHHRVICLLLGLRPARLPEFYPILKDELQQSWKAQALFKKFDVRANHKVYAKGQACPNTRVLVIGAGPCGLRAAIECQLLGAKVVVIEKRDRMSRNNVLHLWPFLIHDLRALGAKKLYGKFCAGSIDHISIRQLQCILLKICLLLGVEFHEGVSFEELIEPTADENNEMLGWRARVSPPNHLVSQYEFDTLIGADGKRNTLRGFKRKDFRGKLAIAITANFINKHTEQEASVEEISGVAFIFKQKFFKDLYRETGIDLENIVYYKDETHYFVMTAKKHSLLEKGVLKRDYPETTLLLSKQNVDRNALNRYAREAATYSTNGQLPMMEYALNHYGEPDVTLFDFTSMYAAENASMVLERSGRRLLCALVGDSLLEPFWPTGSGCARGFLSALDAAWAVRAWGQTPPPHPLTVIMERESIYRLLAQTTPENLNRDFGSYTLDPRTRYPNLNKAAVTAHRVAAFYNSDDPLPLDESTSMRKRRRETQTGEEALVGWVRRAVNALDNPTATTVAWAVSPSTLAALLRTYRPDLMPADSGDAAVYDVLMGEFYIQPMAALRNVLRGDVSDGRMRSYLRNVYRLFKGEVPHIQRSADVGSEMERSENGNYQEERRSDSSRRYRKRKSRNSQVSSPPTAGDFEPLLRGVGGLRLDDFSVGKRECPRRRREVGKLSVGEDWLTEKPKAQPERVLPGSKRVSVLPQLRAEALGKRRAAREIARMHFEKSLRLLAASPEYVAAGAVDLENDYGLQQYRAAAPEFGERVRKLERKLMHTEEGRLVGVGSRSGSGATVARLAAELAEGGKRRTPPRTSKPSDLLRSVGRIESSDWNVASIERKMEENRMGRPQPRQAERVPKWDREKYVARKQRLETGASEREEPLGELEQAVKHIDQLRRDSGRPALGTNKVARLAEGFDKRPLPEGSPSQLVSPGKPWSPAAAELVNAAAAACVVCNTRVFAAERVVADGLTVHRSCFRCAQCRMALRAGMFLVMGNRLTCLHHSQSALAESSLQSGDVAASESTAEMPERITLEASDAACAEMDEDEWAGRNCLASETSAVGGLSEESSSDEEYAEAASASRAPASHSAGADAPEGAAAEGAVGGAHADDPLEIYISDSYEDFSDDDTGGSSSSGHDSSRLLAAREARRSEVPAAGRPPSDSSEVESEDESDTDSKTSSATQVSTDSEFEEEEAAPSKTPPAITVTAPAGTRRAPTPPTVAEAPVKPIQSHRVAARAPPPPVRSYTEFPLSRTRSAGGIATKRALELKRRYLLGEPSPTAVRRSDSASHIDSQFENFTTNISQFQALLNPAPNPTTQSATTPQRPRDLFTLETTNEVSEKTPTAESRDLLADVIVPKTPLDKQIETDSLSDSSESTTDTGPSPPVPRLEVHDASGELVQLDSLIIIDSSPDERKSKANEITERYSSITIESSPDERKSKESESTKRYSSMMIESSPDERKSKENESAEPDSSVTESPEDVRSIGNVRSEPDSSVTESPEDVRSEGNVRSEPDSSVTESPEDVASTGPRGTERDSVILIDSSPEVRESKEMETTDSESDTDSSESCRDPTTLALTETELSDYGGDGGMLDELGLEEKTDGEKRTSARNPRVLSAPKNIHEAKNISTVSAHVCGRGEEEPVIFSNATDHFEFADEGDDASVTAPPMRNSGYMEFVDEFDTEAEDRSMDYIERASSCIERPSEPYVEFSPVAPRRRTPSEELKSPQSLGHTSPVAADGETPTITEVSSILNNGNLGHSKSSFTTENSTSTACSEEFHTDPSRSVSFSSPLTLLVNSTVPYEHIAEESPERPAEVAKAQELKRERDQQTEVVRRLVMERIGAASVRKSRRRAAAPPPPVPAPPVIPAPPDRPPPPLRLGPSMSDPELTRSRRRRGVLQTVSDFFNRRVGLRKKSQSLPANLHSAWEEWGECACVSPPRGGPLARGAPASEPRAPRRAGSHGPLPPAHHRSQCCPPLHAPRK